jgi:hypothetical protein
MKQTPFTRSYRLLLVASHIALVILFVAIMNFSRLFQGILVALSVLVFIWIFTPRGTDEPPCGEEVGSQGIARHMQEWHQAD